MKKQEFIIDDTTIDLSDVPEMTDEEYEEYRAKRRQEIKREIEKKNH